MKAKEETKIKDNTFGEEFEVFIKYFSFNSKISNYFDNKTLKKIKESKRASDLDVKTLALLEIFLVPYVITIHIWPEPWQACFILKVVNEVLVAQNLEPFELDKEEPYQMDLDSIDLDKPAIYIDDDNHVDVSEKYVVNWSPWPEDADTYSLGEQVITELIYSDQIKGKSYIQVMSTELGVNAFDYNQELESDIDFDLVSINTPELEKVKDYYMSRISIKDLSRYDNIICVIEDDPNYSGSGKEYKTNTILITSKDKSYIINIAFSREKSYLSPEEEREIVKKITKRQFIS